MANATRKRSPWSAATSPEGTTSPLWISPSNLRRLFAIESGEVGPTPSGLVAALQGLAHYRYNFLYVMAIVLGFLGAFTLTNCLIRWRKGHHDLLLVKMARAWVESQHAVPPSAP